MVPQETKQEVTTTKHNGLQMRWQVAATLVASSIPDDDPKHRAKISRLKMDADHKLDDVCTPAQPITLDIVAFIAHGAELMSDDGEVKQVIRIVLRDASDLTYSTCSDAFMNSFAPLANDLGKGAWSPPLRLIVKKCKSRNNPGHYLVCCEDDGETPTQATITDKKKKN